MFHFKTITWNQFIDLVVKADVVQIDDVPDLTICSFLESQLQVSWTDSDQQIYHYYFDKDDNGIIEVSDDMATLISYGEEPEKFKFKFFNLSPIAI